MSQVAVTLTDRFSFLLAIVVAALGLGLAVPTAAAPIAFKAQARVSEVNNAQGLLGNFFPITPSVDDIVSLTLTFDPEAVGPVQFPDPGNTDIAFYTGGVTNATITVGNVTLESTGGFGQGGIIVTPLEFDEIENATRQLIGVWDGYGFTAGALGPPGSSTRWGLNLAFVDGDIETVAPPESIPFLDQFAGAGIGFRSFDTSSSPEVFDSFTALLIDVQPVPVPAAVWLFGSALALLGWLRRRSP